jgi:acyl-CoA synthetase (AMP-forming)/AMP-acid ligase II
MPNSFRSLAEPIIRNAHSDPQRTAIIFYAEDETQQTITTAQLLDRVKRFAQSLQSNGVRTGDIVVLALRHQIELVYAFWATLYLGAIPTIFPYPPFKLDRPLYLERIKNFVAYCRSPFAVTADQFANDLNLLLRPNACQAIGIDQLAASLIGTNFPPEEITGDELAVLQHSSGTTGAQKGIAHSHRMFLDSLENITRWLPRQTDDVIVGWLPLFHDLGLITELLMPAYENLPVVMLSPLAWIFKPIILFQAIQQHRGTWCWLPNFALNHCVRSINDAALNGITLNPLRVLRCTAEPTRADSLRAFAEKFKPFGFSEKAYSCVYGMTEIIGGLTVTPIVGPPAIDWIDRSELQINRQAVPTQNRSSNAMSIVSCGAPVANVEVEIVDEHDQLLPDRVVGYIRARSVWMLKEYFNAPEKTAQSIRDGWFYTGDMGYLADGQLYVCGRQKDVIITYGKNIYPEDLEEIANKIDGLAPGRNVAFGVMDEQQGTEGVVMVCELRPNIDPDQTQLIERALRQQAMQVLNIALADVRLVRERDWVIKTTSGKIARSANREKYLKVFAQKETQ